MPWTTTSSQLDGAPVTDVYQLVLSEVEAPLLEQVMKHTRSNQTKASVMLGLNRGTLRKKLKQYGLFYFLFSGSACSFRPGTLSLAKSPDRPSFAPNLPIEQAVHTLTMPL